MKVHSRRHSQFLRPQQCDKQIHAIKHKYGLDDAEIHTGWILRNYLEQSRIPDFEKLSYADRRSAVIRERAKEIYRLQHSGNKKLYKQCKKNYRMTEAYVHLTRDERTALIQEIADKIGSWQFARLFAEGVDKTHFNPTAKHTIDEMALEQIVSRFEQYMTKKLVGIRHYTSDTCTCAVCVEKRGKKDTH